jgi:proline iminopeptidase
MKRLWLIALCTMILVAIGCQQESELQIKEGFLTGADGVQLFYRMMGSSENIVVFLHGSPSRSNAFAPDFEPLCRNNTLIFYDQRGGGRSDLITDPTLLTWKHHVRDLEAVREHFGLEKMKILGISWGSMLAAFYGAEYPERVERLLLLPTLARQNPEPPDTTDWTDQLSSEERERIDELMRIWADAEDPVSVCREYWSISLPYFFADPDSFSRMRSDFCDEPPEALRNTFLVAEALFQSLSNYDLRPMLSAISAPSLIMKGTLSTMRKEWVEEWAITLPNARMQWIPEAGMAVWIEKADLFFRAADQFLKGEWPEEAIILK